jgi:NADH:ubiquinone oxidoreductase subunit 5 (subunit L)/multisubunit Na+/H+ antiporter MnhA subunit
MEHLNDTIMFVAMLALFAWLLWLLLRRYQMSTQTRLQRMEAFNKLIEKFGTAAEFIAFLNTEQGKQFLQQPLPQQSNPEKITLRFVQAGVILGALSIAIGFQWHRLWVFTHSQPNPDMNWVNKEMDFHYWMALTIALSLGMFVIAWVTSRYTKKLQTK